MTGLKNLVQRIYQVKVRSDLIRQITLPVAVSPAMAANGAGSTYGAWVDIALAATVQVDSLIVGVCLNHGSANDEYTVDIGSCVSLGIDRTDAATINALAAAIIAGAHRQEVRVDITGANLVPITFMLYSPVFIPALTGILGRCYGITAAAVTINMSVILLQGW